MENRLPDSLKRVLPLFRQGWNEDDEGSRFRYGQFKSYYEVNAEARRSYRQVLDKLDDVDSSQLLPYFEDERREHRAYIQ